MSALFIVNTLSDRVAKTGSRLADYGKIHNIDVYDIGDFTGLSARIVRAASDNTTQVFIEGGDGTIHGVLSEFLRQKDQFVRLPDFAIIAGGMTNQIAKNIGLKPSLIAKALTGDLSYAETSLLEITASDTRPQYGFLFSTGAVPMVTEYTKTQLHGHGIGGSLAVAGGILKGVSSGNNEVLHTTPIKLKSPRHPHIEKNEDHLGTIVTTLSGLIMGLDPFWGKEHAPLRLTYLDKNYRRLYRNLAGLWTGQKNKDRSKDGLHSWNIENIEYEYHGPCVLDGETLTFPSGQFTIKASQPLRFIQAK